MNANDRSLRGLQRLTKKRCTTIFIGALDSIEQKLGYLWGFDKSLQDLTERERLFLQLWRDLRKEILDKGNKELKSLLAELDYFDVSLKHNQYSINLGE